MAKLADLLGKYLVEWPDGAVVIAQERDCELFAGHENLTFDGVCAWHGKGKYFYGFLPELASDWNTAQVTMAEYLAARDRIATNQQATQEAREIAQGEELPKRDSKLWKRAALAAFAGYCARPGMDAECAAEEAMFAADAFMNAMEKHLSSN